MAHKAGFVNIVGNPNVGKSTLMNALVGERLSIITSKSQTTRHRIIGIDNTDDYQIIYTDTPGVLKPHYKLQESMMKFASSALEDADILLYVTDVYEKIDKNEEFLQKVRGVECPVLLLINKVDLSNQEKLEEMVDTWKEMLPNAIIIPISALSKFNLDNLMKTIIEMLPEHPGYYSKEELTDKSQRFFVSEIIREKILLYYQKEVPYSTEVEITDFKEKESITAIRAVIHVARETQKGIIIGHRGAALKKLGTEARKSIEAFLGQKVFLELFVKVSKDWRDNDKTLRNFGYMQ
jgi:GTPase